MTERRFPELGPEQAMELYLASLVSVPELAHELKRLGISDDDDCLEDARELIPVLHEAVEEARRGA